MGKCGRVPSLETWTFTEESWNFNLSILSIRVIESTFVMNNNYESTTVVNNRYASRALSMKLTPFDFDSVKVCCRNVSHIPVSSHSYVHNSMGKQRLADFSRSFVHIFFEYGMSFIPGSGISGRKERAQLLGSSLNCHEQRN